MDPTDSFFHHHRPSSPAVAAVNGMFSSGEVLFPHAVNIRPSAAPAPVAAESVRRKRGRPRKYGVAQSNSASASGAGPKKESNSSRKTAQLEALGNAGQGFTPHVITIAEGEDVTQKIMSFVQQSKRVVCIFSSSGSVSSASLCQSGMLGGNVTYEGRFQILSLSGSFVHSETAGAASRTGGISVCLSGVDGGVVGGSVGGPLIAADPVQVIVGSFYFVTDNAFSASMETDPSSKLQLSVPAGMSIVTPSTFRSVESSGRMTTSRGSDNIQSAGGSGSSNHILQSQPIPFLSSRLPADWTMGRQERRACLSPDDEDDYHIQD